ncbi:hypothetical protein E3H11_31180 [Bradyrhizobium brasilense]|uniref:hypothetical protein n=1 Tax=Bradyrhizobium brasilense TaxID=1419277 RepID=UPI001457284A|nr:hypothetical protein [Bradyrhizobium brasilense]NLS73292.1 hypothetical protein [Bradyrhizobium brasilense]
MPTTFFIHEVRFSDQERVELQRRSKLTNASIAELEDELAAVSGNLFDNEITRRKAIKDSESVARALRSALSALEQSHRPTLEYYLEPLVHRYGGALADGRLDTLSNLIGSYIAAADELVVRLRAETPDRGPDPDHRLQVALRVWRVLSDSIDQPLTADDKGEFVEALRVAYGRLGVAVRDVERDAREVLAQVSGQREK